VTPPTSHPALLAAVRTLKAPGVCGVANKCTARPEEKSARAKVDDFLRKRQAAFTNLLADGDPDEWYNKLGIGAIPCVFVFDRENRRVKKLVGEEVKYETIEAEVARMLKK
jgi:hypothetical protein